MLSYLDNWPDPGCISRGWAKTPEGLPTDDKRTRHYRSSSLWSLGNPVRFYAEIYDFAGVETGLAESTAVVWFKMPDKQFKEVARIDLHNPCDVLGVVEALHEKYSIAKTAEAKEWNRVMAGFEEELVSAQKSVPEIEVIEEPVDEEVPEFIHAVFSDWRYTVIDDYTPESLLEAFIRFERSWTAYSSCVLADMMGDIYREELKRSDRIGMLIDRKLHQTKDLDDQIRLINLFRLMLPCYIGTYEEIENSNVDYERTWSKSVAEDIVKTERALDYPAVSLLIRVREDNKRLPAPLSKFIKTRIPKYLDGERTRLDRTCDMTTDKLRDDIRLLDNYVQWHIQCGAASKKVHLEADAYMNLISSRMEKEDDLTALTLYSNLLTTCFAAEGTIKDRESFCSRIERKLIDLKRTRTVQPSLAESGDQEAIRFLTEEFTLAALFLENVFLQSEGIDIYTYYWQLHQRNIEENRAFRESSGDLWFW